jgi:metallo-beta-lactamase family protein
MYPTKPKRQIMCFESTYGDLHSDSDPKLELEMHINNTRRRDSLYTKLCSRTCTNDYVFAMATKRRGKIPDVPYIMDSPMGVSVIFLKIESGISCL